MSHWREEPTMWDEPITLPYKPKNDFFDPVRLALAMDMLIREIGEEHFSLPSSESLSEDCSLRLS